MDFLDHIEHRCEIICVDMSLRLFFLLILLRVEECCEFCEIFLDIYLWLCLSIFMDIEVTLSTDQLHILISAFLVNTDPVGSPFWTVIAVGRFELRHLFFHENLDIRFSISCKVIFYFYLRFLLHYVAVILTQSLASV